MLEFYLSIGSVIMGVVMGMHCVQGKLPSLKRYLFVFGALFGWPAYLPYIWRNIEVKK